MHGEWNEIRSIYRFCRKKQMCLAFVYSCTIVETFFLRIEYFMMGRRKHSKERRQFHFDCCTSADFQFAKLQFKRHAKITRRVNIEWDDGVNDAKRRNQKKKKKRKFRVSI